MIALLGCPEVGSRQTLNQRVVAAQGGQGPLSHRRARRLELCIRQMLSSESDDDRRKSWASSLQIISFTPQTSFC
jgi:hypothetical protein